MMNAFYQLLDYKYFSTFLLTNPVINNIKLIIGCIIIIIRIK